MHAFRNFWLRLLWEESGEVDLAADPAAADPAPASDPAPAASDPAPDPAAAPVDDIDPAFAGLDAAMKAVLPQDEPPPNAADPNAQPVAAFPEALATISPYVTDEASAQRAIQAASEVWGVASGQIPARQMLEGFRQVNPEQFEAIAADLREYLGVPTEAQPAGDPFEAFKAAHPQQFSAVQAWLKQQGIDIGGAPDPREARLSALEARYAQEEEQRQTAAHNAQIDQARGKAAEFMTAALKDHFAEGMADRYLAPGTGLLWMKAQQMQIDPARLQGELLQGKTDTLQKVWKAVEKDEAATIRRFNENLIKRHKTLSSSVPASKNGKVQPIKQVQGAPIRKPGESDTAYATRVWESGFTA